MIFIFYIFYLQILSKDIVFIICFYIPDHNACLIYYISST